MQLESYLFEGSIMTVFLTGTGLIAAFLSAAVFYHHFIGIPSQILSYVHIMQILFWIFFSLASVGIATDVSVSIKRKKIAKSIKSRLPELNESQVYKLAPYFADKKNFDSFLNTFALVVRNLPKVDLHDAMAVTNEVITGRKLDDYSIEDGLLCYHDVDLKTYFVGGRWSYTKEKIKLDRSYAKELYEKEREFIEETYPNIEFPKVRLDKLCSLMYFNWKIISIEQVGLEICAELVRRDEKMTLKFPTDIDLYMLHKNIILSMHPQLKNYSHIVDRLSKLMYQGWAICKISEYAGGVTANLTRNQQSMDLELKFESQ